jgi:hypothetical protein
MQTAEFMNFDGKWCSVGIAAALDHHEGRDFRCEECHGRVWAHRDYIDGASRHFAHAEAHNGCSLKSYSFSGIKSPHPNALE